MKRLFTFLMLACFIFAGISPAFAKHGKFRGYHKHYKHQRVKYVAYPYYAPRYYYPYYAPVKRVYVNPVVYPAYYYPAPSLFNVNLRL